MLAVIFANGALVETPEMSRLVQTADLIIAADGGAAHCQRLVLTPDILLGDLDSVDPALPAAYAAKGVTIDRHPAQKDATDLELALDLAIRQGATTIWLLGALGGRWDMSLANIMLAAGDKYRDRKISLLGENCSMRVLHPGNIHALEARPGQQVSILPLKGDAHGITLTGFAYPLTEHSIPFGSSLGVSNIMQGSEATVTHREGILLCVLFSE